MGSWVIPLSLLVRNGLTSGWKVGEIPFKVAKTAVKAAEAQANRDAMDRYDQYMVVWGDKCAILYANGKCGKALPLKTPHPFKGKKGKRPPPPVINHAPLPKPVAHPHCAAAPTNVILVTVDYEDGS